MDGCRCTQREGETRAMAGARFFRFGAFRMDCGQRLVMHRGQRVPLRGKAFDLLELLVRRDGQLVDKAALLAGLWPGVAVHENNIAVTVRSLRKALQQCDPALNWIETVPGRGYRFAAGVLPLASMGAAAVARCESTAPPSRLLAAAERDAEAASSEPFVAREAELERLDALWAAARGGHGQVVFVSGEPGIGKTALLRRFMERAVERAPLSLVMQGQCIQLFGLADPHLPWRDALAAGLASPARAELLEALQLYAPGWCARLPPALVGARAERAEPYPAAHAGAYELVEALRAVASSRPLLLVLEDLHWADASSIDVLRWLCGRVDGRSLLVLGTYRPAPVRAEWHPLGALLADVAGRGQWREIALAPWSSDELERYLAARFGAPALAATLGPVIERRSEGLPLFAVRLVESLLARELVRRDANGSWALALPVEALEPSTPSSVAALIASQLEPLPPAWLRLLELASVDGAEFGSRLLSEVLGEAAVDIERVLERLAARGLIDRISDGLAQRRPEGDELAGLAHLASLAGPVDVRYRFRHVLYRDHLYGQLGSHRRLELHLAVARALDSNQPALLASPSQLAFHFERGRDFSRAVACWTQAGDAADRAFAKQEALECYERAAALLDALPSGERALRRLVLEHGRGWASHGLSRARAARQHFQEFARLAREIVAAPEPEREPALALALDYFARPWSDVVMRRPAGIFPKQASGDIGSELLAEALHCCCHADCTGGRSDGLLEHARALESLAAASRSEPRRAEALAWLGVHALLAGHAERARTQLDAALELARRLDHQRALRLALEHRAWLHRMQAELERAQAVYEELWRCVPDAATAAGVQGELGATLAARGQPSAALDAYARADRLRQRIDPGSPSLHGWLWRELGQPSRARELDAAALARLRDTGEPLLRARLWASLASSACRLGERAAAAEALRQADALVPAERRECSWRMGPIWSARCEFAALARDAAPLQHLARCWLGSAHARADAEGVKHACRWLALALARSGEPERARGQLALGIEATTARPVPLVDWRCQALLVQLALRTGDEVAAERARDAAWACVEAIARGIDDEAEQRSFERMAERELSALPSARRAARASS